MRDAVHAAGGAHRGRQAERQFRIVDDGTRQHLPVAPGDLALVLGEPEIGVASEPA